MSDIEDIVAAIQSKPLTDILVVGYVDNSDGARRFHPRLTTVYLQFAHEFMVRCTSIDQYDKLKLDLVREISFDFPLRDDQSYCTSSIAELLLATPYWDQHVTAIRVYIDQDSRLSEGIVKCAGLRIQDVDSLFLDPTHIFGIQLGKREAEKMWAGENAGAAGRYSLLTWQIENLPGWGRTP
jgi:hypothetical protein